MSETKCELCSFVFPSFCVFVNSFVLYIELPVCCVVSELVLYELVSSGSFSVDSIYELLYILIVFSLLMLVDAISELKLVDFVESLSEPKSFVFGPEL